tara:strand:+ start:1642 stop:2100 length:459 start_codon:yes stop_codon:yes gene_type:complete
MHNHKAHAQGMVNKKVHDICGKCPLATQDVAENTKNRNWTIDNYGYGPMNPDAPNMEFWEKKSDIFDTTVEEAMTARCGNCSAFDQSCSIIDCMAKGINEDSAADPYQVIKHGNLGYCQLFKFKCAGARTCDAWVHGGPIRGEKIEQLNSEY